MQGAALADEAFTDPGAVFGFQLPGFAGILGLFVLGLVLAYGRQAPWWSPFAMVAGIFGRRSSRHRHGRGADRCTWPGPGSSACASYG